MTINMLILFNILTYLHTFSAHYRVTKYVKSMKIVRSCHLTERDRPKIDG